MVVRFLYLDKVESTLVKKVFDWGKKKGYVPISSISFSSIPRDEYIYVNDFRLDELGDLTVNGTRIYQAGIVPPYDEGFYDFPPLKKSGREVMEGSPYTRVEETSTQPRRLDKPFREITARLEPSNGYDIPPCYSSEHAIKVLLLMLDYERVVYVPYSPLCHIVTDGVASVIKRNDVDAIVVVDRKIVRVDYESMMLEDVLTEKPIEQLS
ncbi:MAG: hypothetical protein J7K98_02710 [Candidatus Aenigmarchaeota archaeon]|nr:hypothetical protein [Candidatus Aenigmarchaeota archaeon]